MTNPLSQPLQGIRVLDLTSVLFGPYSTQILGDFGADVVKIEAPGGDPTRGLGPARNVGMAAGFLGCNRNKRSVQLDLKRAPARSALWHLIDGADVFVHNIRPQKIAALGFTPEAVLTRKADIVYAVLHGCLMEGPSAGYPKVISAERKPYATKDGYISMLAYSDKQWRSFWALTDTPECRTGASL